MLGGGGPRVLGQEGGEERGRLTPLRGQSLYRKMQPGK
jgi:hypothetical protein